MMIFEDIIEKLRESNEHGLEAIEKTMFLSHVVEKMIELEDQLKEKSE